MNYKFYIDLENVLYCYMDETSKITNNLGVLEKYKDKFYTQKEINEIIADLIIKMPYIPNAYTLHLSIKYRDKKGAMCFYHVLDFSNLEYVKQKKNTDEILFLF